MQKRKQLALILLVGVFFSFACGIGPLNISLGPTATPTATNTPLPTNTPLATSTPLPTNTALPSPTSKPSSTPKPAPTSAPGTTGSFDTITFAPGVLNDDTAIDPLDSYPQGTAIVYAVFDFSGMKDGQTWKTEWLLDGTLQSNLTQTEGWKGGGTGTWWVSVFNKDGIHTGEWTLNLYIGTKLQQTAKFTIEQAASDAQRFGPIIFAKDQANDKPVGALSVDKAVFAKGTTTVYVFFDGVNVANGTTWTSQWFKNGDSYTDPKDHTWTFGPNDNEWISCCTGGNAFDPGTYEVKLTIDGNLVGLGTFIVSSK